MGLFAGYVLYRLGKRRGRKSAAGGPVRDVFCVVDADRAGTREDCVNYWSFCKEFGSCDGQECEYN